MTKTSAAAPRRALPAIAGGKPAFDAMLPITMPTLPPSAGLRRRYDEVLKSGMLTNASNVREFEAKMADHLGVKHAVAVNSCTAGLMLVMKAFGLKGEIIIPGLTFHATAHAAVWNGLAPVFVDSAPGTYTVDPKEVEKAITPRTSAILAVHLFGLPCDIAALEGIAKRRGLKLIFDAAHGAGSRYKGKSVGGFGDAESFSLSPTKLLTAGEGGIVSTNDDALAQMIRVGRNYGDSGDYDCEFSGFNARMSEFHALLGVESLKYLEANAERRNRLAEVYAKALSGVPGIEFQKIPAGSRSSYKDFAIVIDPAVFGISRDRLCEAMAAENIVVKKYFYPPVHWQKAFKNMPGARKTLPVAERVSSNTLSLPLYSHMPEETARKVAAALVKIHAARAEVNAASR